MKYGKYLGVVAVAAIAAVVALPAFAEVQNVRVGGDLTTYGFVRDSLRLSEDRTNGVGNSTGNALGGGGDNFIQSHLGLNVDADLTDNVSTNVRLVGQRVWGDNLFDASNTSSNSVNQVEVANAYVTLKEFMYAPLTLKIGRQPLWYGRGFIIGSRILAGDVDGGQNIAADEFSLTNGFDAIRATLDAPMGLEGITIDGLYSVIAESNVSGADDTKLIGVNVGWKGGAYNSEAEVYFFDKRDKGSLAKLGGSDNRANVSVMGIRGSAEPVSNVSTWGELAYQFGHRANPPTALGTPADARGANGDAQQAWGIDLGVDYSMPDTAWNPKFGGEWIFYSGHDLKSDPGAIAGWDPFFRGNFSTALREFQAFGLYLPSQSTATGNFGTFGAVTSSTTNQHQLALHAMVKPLDALSVDNRLTWFILDKGYIPQTGQKRQHFAGTEWDVQAKYAYTEDVQLGLIYGIFWPGSVFRSPFDDIAQELVTSLKVSF